MEASSDNSDNVPQNVESETKNNDDSVPEPAVDEDTNKETEIKTEVETTPVEDDQNDDELLAGYITDGFCHVCCVNLSSEGHRLSHYLGRKHAQKVKMFLRSVKAENALRAQGVPTDKNRFCELCNMSFSSPTMARVHYEGKIHLKNLRKNGLNILDSEGNSLPALPQDSVQSEQKLKSDTDLKLPKEPTKEMPMLFTETPSKDPNKYCSLCCCSINNPVMSFQHYNGRKHQRSQAKQELLKQLGKEEETAESLTCDLCDVVTKSVRSYQFHLKSSKHLAKERKLGEFFHSQFSRNNSKGKLQERRQGRQAHRFPSMRDQVHPEDCMQDQYADYDVYGEGFNDWDMNDNTRPYYNPSQTSNPEMEDASCSTFTLASHVWDDWSSPLYVGFDGKSEEESGGKRRKQEQEDTEEKRRKEILLFEKMERKREKKRAKRRRQKMHATFAPEPATKQYFIPAQTAVDSVASNDGQQTGNPEENHGASGEVQKEEENLWDNSILGC